MCPSGDLPMGKAKVQTKTTKKPLAKLKEEISDSFLLLFSYSTAAVKERVESC